MIEVIAFPNRYTRGWPEHDDKRASRCTVAELLTTRFQRDAHFAAYVADVERRHTIALLQDPANAPRIAGANLRMVLAVFDVDDPVAHETESPARAEWRDVEIDKLAALLDEHPGAFLYSTTGGHRIVYSLAKPYTLRSQRDDVLWTARYKSWARYLDRQFGIAVDTSCSDWTRLFRAPFVVRDGKVQTPSTFGDPAALGTWAPKLKREDIVRPKRGSEVHGAVEPVPIDDPTNEYGQARISGAVRYLERAPLVCFATSGQAVPRRNAMLGIAAYLVRRLRMPIGIAAECVERVYNARLIAAGMTPWSMEEPGDYDMSIVERLEHARDTAGKIPPGEVLTEKEWREWNEVIGKAAS